MKKSKLVLLLPAACLLCSCGEPGSDFKEIKKDEVPAKANAIDQKATSDSWELPTKLTYTLSTSVSGKAPKEMEEAVDATGEIKVIFDTDNNYLYGLATGNYSSEFGKNVSKFEAWMYKDGDSFIYAISSGDEKLYAQVSSERFAEAYDELREEFTLNKDDIKQTLQGTVSKIKQYATTPFDASVSTSSGSVSTETKFYSKNDGDLKVTLKQSLSSSSTSYTMESTAVIASYLPAYFYSKASGKANGTDFSIEMKNTFDWNKADTSNKPNLKDFKESSEK